LVCIHSPGLVAGKIKIVDQETVKERAEFTAQTKKHCVKEDMLKKIVPSFKGWGKSTITLWWFSEPVRYTEAQVWRYTGPLQGNPTFATLKRDHMSFLERHAAEVPKTTPCRKRVLRKSPPPPVEEPPAPPPEEEHLQKKQRVEAPHREGCHCQQCKKRVVGGLTYGQRRKRKGRDQSSL
jgi:hypothetical protein